MKTIHELKKYSPAKLSSIINKEVEKVKQQSKDELTKDYFARHPDYKDLPDFLNNLYDNTCNYSAIGQLIGSLIFAIEELQKAEAKLKASKV